MTDSTTPAFSMSAALTDYKRLQFLMSVMKADPVLVLLTPEGVLFARDGSSQGWLFTKVVDSEEW